MQVDHKAKAYIAPKKPLVPNNSSSNVTGMLAGTSCIIFCGFSRVKGSRIWGSKAEAKMGRCRHLPKVNLATILQAQCFHCTALQTHLYVYYHRCEKTVFIAEMMRAAGQTFHKSCFTCQVTHINPSIRPTEFNHYSKSLCKLHYVSSYPLQNVNFYTEQNLQPNFYPKKACELRQF